MAVEFKLPDLGEGIHEAEIIAVRVKEGETVKEDQPILEVETDKAVVEIPCPVAGVVEKINVKAGQSVKVGMVMMSFSTDGSAKAPAKTEEKKEHKEPVGAAKSAAPAQAQVNTEGGSWVGNRTAADGPVPAAPAVRRLARELGIDLMQVPGSGPAGRVLNEDVRSYAAGKLEGHFQSGPKTAQTSSTCAQTSGLQRCHIDQTQHPACVFEGQVRRL